MKHPHMIWGAAALLLLFGLFGCVHQAAEEGLSAAKPVLEAVELTAAPISTMQVPISVTVAVDPTEAPVAVTVPPTPSPEPTPAPTPTPEPTEPPGPLAGIIIGIDPGHQLIYDPAPEPVAPNSYKTKQKVAGGCRGVKSRIYEYEVVLNVGLYLRDYLSEAGATVVMTHDVLDVNISNIERAEMFNEANVDLGIRLHCNNSDKPSVCGAFMIVPIESRTDYYDFNVSAAKTILAAYLAETGLPMRYKEGMTYRGDQTGFNWCTRPIMTIEMGHLTNPAEDALLSTDAFQQKMAYGLYQGILTVFTDSQPGETIDPVQDAAFEESEEVNDSE